MISISILSVFSKATAKILPSTLKIIKSVKLILWVFSEGSKRALQAIYILDKPSNLLTNNQL